MKSRAVEKSQSSESIPNQSQTGLGIMNSTCFSHRQTNHSQYRTKKVIQCSIIGDTVLQVGSLKGEPSNIQWLFENSQLSTSVPNISLILNGKSLMFYNYSHKQLQALDSSQTILNFEESFGQIVNYHWFGDSMVIVGFSKGWILTLSLDG